MQKLVGFMEENYSNPGLRVNDLAEFMNMSRSVFNLSLIHISEDALRSAAYTYVVAALSSLATLIYYIMIYMGRRD